MKNKEPWPWRIKNLDLEFSSVSAPCGLATELSRKAFAQGGARAQISSQRSRKHFTDNPQTLCPYTDLEAEGNTVRACSSSAPGVFSSSPQYNWANPLESWTVSGHRAAVNQVSPARARRLLPGHRCFHSPTLDVSQNILSCLDSEQTNIHIMPASAV